MLGTLATILVFIIGGAFVWCLLALTARFTYDNVYQRWRSYNVDRLSFQEHAQQIRLNSIRVLQPDASGRSGVAYDGKVYRDLDTRAVFSQELTVALNPVMEMLKWQHNLLLAMRWGSGKGVPAVDELAQGALVWPTTPVRLADLFIDRQPSINDLVIGVKPKADGLETVSLSLHRLMHTLTVGASGWGKSTWLRSLLWQVARASEPIEVVAVDTSGSEFNVLHEWGKLRYPVARTTDEAIATLQAVSDEIERRKSLYEDYPLVTKLTEYNAATGADLPPWLVCVDEGTNLLNQVGIGEHLRGAVQTARQYGIYVLLAGQSAKHSVVDTQVRDNFSSRLCFRTSPSSSRVVLDDKRANDLTEKGRFWAQLEGQELVELKGPFVSRDDFLRALTNGGPSLGTPPTADVAQDELILQLASEGLGQREIEQRVFGYTGGSAYRKVKAILDGATTEGLGDF